MILKKTNNADHDFITLAQMLDTELSDRYGSLQASYDKYNIINPIDTVIIGYLNNVPIACCCFNALDEETVEIKRMYVCKDARKKGLSVMILSSMEQWAAKLGYSKSILETGKRQHEAIGLYQKFGYQFIENYGPYKGLEMSVCMAKSLTTIQSLIVPGKNSPENATWLQKISDQFRTLDYKVETIAYDHWDKSNQDINIPLELKKIATYSKPDQQIIIAKSIGVILTLIANQQQNICPKAAVFMGAPVNEDQTKDFIELIMPAKFPILMIQQDSDKLTSFKNLEQIILNINKENISMVSIKGSDHVYDDFDQIIPKITHWIYKIFLLGNL